MVNIFLIDDSPEFIDSAKKLLELEGFEVIGYSYSGREGIEKIKELKPDLVLVDIVMPEMNGLSVAKIIKEMEDSPKVVILTLYDNPEYRKAGEEIGVDGFLSKSNFVSNLKDLLVKLFPKGAIEEEVKNILIVDDSKTLRKMVITVLSKLGNVNFEEAESGLYALEKLALKKIDLMILDLNMPDMHGLDVLRFLRGSDLHKSLPVIVLTTRGDEEMRNLALREGANFYMTKPFNPEDLLNKVREFLRLR